MSLICIPENWTLSLIAKNNSVRYMMFNDKNPEEYIKIIINIKNDVAIGTINHSGTDVGPEMELVFSNVFNDFSFSPIELFYLMITKYKNFYREHKHYELENLVASCLADLSVRKRVAYGIEEEASIVIDKKIEGF